jgi:UDP-N-acetylglucosamine 2-epimerase (non-hydrolysing)
MKSIIISVVGTRPNFIKMKPIINKLNNSRFKNILVHTGQHYDYKMSNVFFDELDLPEPDYHLDPLDNNSISKITSIMTSFNQILEKEKPSLVVVPGDVDSTLACSIVAAKRDIKIAHIESGLRSFDKEMPEEINRLITDRLSSYHFVTEKSGYKNLINEGFSSKSIHYVGNTMIDTLIEMQPKFECNSHTKYLKNQENGYCLVTIHRPSNVDRKDQLEKIILMLNELSKIKKIVFPIHPRTKKKIDEFKISLSNSIVTTDPLSYLKFMSLIKGSDLIITDSGGIQEETTFLGTKCATLRKNTERPVTIESGTNFLVGDDPEKALVKIKKILKDKSDIGVIPDKWDGKSAERIVRILNKSII